MNPVPLFLIIVTLPLLLGSVFYKTLKLGTILHPKDQHFICYFVNTCSISVANLLAIISTLGFRFSSNNSL